MKTPSVLPMRYAVLLLVLGALPGGTVLSQTSGEYKRAKLVITGGVGTALSGKTMKDFWNPGMSGSLGLLFHVSRPVAFGIVLDGTYLAFDDSGFAAAYPAVPVHATNITLIGLAIQGRWSPLSQYALSPFLSGSIGGTHTTAATYQQMIQGKRQTYYNIKAKNRLSLGASAGADISVAPWMWIELEAKGCYSYRDPDLKFSAFGRAGVQFRL